MSNQGGLARRRLAKLALVLMGLLIGAIIAEVALRVVGYSYPEFYTLDQSPAYAIASTPKRNLKTSFELLFSVIRIPKLSTYRGSQRSGR
jgi:hypothetical protein